MNWKLPAQYSKFITALIGALVLYLQKYGATWYLVPAVSSLSASLAVLGVPNAIPLAKLVKGGNIQPTLPPIPPRPTLPIPQQPGVPQL